MFSRTELGSGEVQAFNRKKYGRTWVDLRHLVALITNHAGMTSSCSSDVRAMSVRYLCADTHDLRTEPEKPYGKADAARNPA